MKYSCLRIGVQESKKRFLRDAPELLTNYFDIGAVAPSGIRSRRRDAKDDPAARSEPGSLQRGSVARDSWPGVPPDARGRDHVRRIWRSRAYALSDGNLGALGIYCVPADQGNRNPNRPRHSRNQRFGQHCISGRFPRSSSNCGRTFLHFSCGSGRRLTSGASCHALGPRTIVGSRIGRS